MSTKHVMIGIEQFFIDLEKIMLPEYHVNHDMAIEYVVESSKDINDSSFNLIIPDEQTKDNKSKAFLFQTYSDDDATKIISYLSFEN